jgi:hypothetical protein
MPGSNAYRSSPKTLSNGRTFINFGQPSNFRSRRPSGHSYLLCRGSVQLVVPPTVPAPRVAEYCGLQATSGWVRLLPETCGGHARVGGCAAFCLLPISGIIGSTPNG